MEAMTSLDGFSRYTLLVTAAGNKAQRESHLQSAVIGPTVRRGQAAAWEGGRDSGIICGTS